MHAAGLIALGHLLVDDSPAGSHPLNVARADGAPIAHAVAVFHGAGENVGDGFYAAVRMPWEPSEIILGNIVAKVVEEEKGVKVGCVAEAKCAAQVHSGTFERRFGLHEALHWT